jgi:hypothetical protein
LGKYRLEQILDGPEVMKMITEQAARQWCLLTALLATMGLWATPAAAQIPVLGGMLDPAIDEAGKPFSYFWHPTDVIGALDAPVASEVTPEGYVYTGFGELMFFVGIPPEPVNVRIKTLHHGYLPIVEYDFCRHGVKYALRIFAADLGGKLQGLPVNFVEVRLENEAIEPRAALFSSAYRFGPPVKHLNDDPAEYRFSQRFDLIPKCYTEGQTGFNSNAKYAFGEGAVLRDGRILYTFPRTPEPDQFTLSLGDKGLGMYRYFTGEVIGSEPRHAPKYDTPVGVVTYRVPLEPRESRTLVFKMPVAPIPGDSAEAKQLLEADSAQHFQRTVAFWEDLVGKRTPLRFPEAKVQEALLANTVFDLLAIDKIGENYITNVNKFQYHAFCGGANPAHMRVGFDYMGLDQIARKTVLYSIAYQFPDGSFDQRAVGSPYYEFLGTNLWCIGRHYQLTQDASFLQQVYPGVVKAMEYEMRTTAKDPLGLFPAYVGIADDAALNGIRQLGPHIWALHGMPHAIAMAKAMGKTDDARRFEAEQQRFRAALEKQLALQTAQSGGWIPPAIERTLLGNHWDNMVLLYPEPLFEPFDPRVTATIRKSRETYAEGILGYVLPVAIGKKGNAFVFNAKPGLHYWHSPDNAENALVRGSAEDQQMAVKDLYALLLHTTSTHAPQEFSTVPWSTRDYYPSDILPDGVASGKIVELMRNMLVREYQNDLYLFSAISPDWLKPGKKIEVVQEPTTFGPISALLSASAEGWEVTLSHGFRQPPQHVVIRVPWFYEVQAAEADGHALPVSDGKLVIAPNTRNIKVKGRIKPSVPELSFERTVTEYKREYGKRYADFLRTGMIQP